jgi:flagellar protein FliJ
LNRFRFRLDNVLKVRAAREDEKKRDFGIAQSHLTQEQGQYSEIKGKIEDLDRYRTEHGAGQVSASQMIQNYSFSRQLQHRLDQQREEVRKAQEVADEKRSRMVEAMKERKTLERLKERRREQYNQDIRREEQALIDEIAGQRHSDETER